MTGKEKLLEILKNYKLANKGNGDFVTNDYQEELLKPIFDDLQKLEDYEAIFKMPIKELREERKILSILKLCGDVRHNELQIYLSDRTDCDIGNGIKEYEAFEIVSEWLEGKNNESEKI